MRLSRRSAVGGLLGLAAGLVPWRRGSARPSAAADDPILLVDGWIVRQSDLDALAVIDRP
jgi:hypothetical protein